MAAILDSEREAVIIKMVSSSALQAERRRTVLLDIRAAMKLCRNGVDPFTHPSTGKCKHNHCQGGNWRVHAFFCGTRRHTPLELELSLREQLKVALNDYLVECRQVMREQQQVRPPSRHVCIASITITIYRHRKSTTAAVSPSIHRESLPRGQRRKTGQPKGRLALYPTTTRSAH